MQSFHCHADILRQTRCQTALGWAAYGGCTKFNYGGRRADYGRHFGDHVANFLLLPPAAPESYFDPLTFLLTLSEAEKKRVDAQEGRTVTFAIPRSVPTPLIVAVAAYVLAVFTQRGMCVYVDIENTEASDGLGNIHVHALISLREIGPGGFGRKERDWNRYFRRDGGRYFRAEVAARLTLACALIGLAVPLDPRRKDERGLGPTEPRLRKTLWKRRQRGEKVGQIEELVQRRREKTAASPPVPEASTTQSRGFTVSNVVSRHIGGKAREAELGVIERYLEQRKVAFERGDGGVRIATDGQGTILLSPDLMVAPGHVTPEIAELLAGCARALDWPAVVAEGDPEEVDTLIVAAARWELAVVNRAAGDRALSLIRSCERLHQAVADYDRPGVAGASVRAYRASLFRRALAYGPQLFATAGALRTNKRREAAQFCRSMSYRPETLKTAVTVPHGSLAADPGRVADTGSLPEFHSQLRPTAAQFVRSMAYGHRTRMSAPAAEVEYLGKAATPKVERPAAQHAAGSGSVAGVGRVETLAPNGEGSPATSPDGLELVTMPEMPAPEGQPCRLDPHQVERFHAEKAQEYDALAQSLKDARLPDPGTPQALGASENTATDSGVDSPQDRPSG